MTLTFVPGYQSKLSLGSAPDDITAQVNVINLTETKAALAKPIMGSQYRRTASGQISVTGTVEGHVTAEEWAVIHGHFLSESPVPFELEVGAAASGTLAGTYQGEVVITSLAADGDAAGEWDFTLAFEADGTVTFTPPTP